MKSSIVPLSAVPSELVIEYLSQGTSPERIRWKYFDAAFNAGRERGFVWFSKGRVRGFIGIIPCTLSTPEGDRDMVWTCDWSIENPGKTPGMGILLLKRVQASYAFVGGVGGSDDTHAVAPGVVTRTFPDAAAFLHLPLRLSGLLEKLETRFPFLPRLSRTPLGSIRLPRKAVGNSGDVIIEEGVSGAIASLFMQPAHDACRTRYDRAYLDWQVGRCPGIRAMSCSAAGNSRPPAGALVWCRVADPRYWRAVFRCVAGAEVEMQVVISAAANMVAEQGGVLLSTVLSHLDHDELVLLKQNGFLEGSQRWPLYVSSEPGACRTGLAGLSYLDTDLATFF